MTDENLIAAIKLYGQHCAICHGTAKGEASASPVAKGLYPRPPQLAAEGVEDDPESFSFWKIKHGIRWTGFLDDGRICLTNNAAERALRGIALGRRAWLFAGSDRGGERAAAMFTLIETAKLNDVDPQAQAWLADVLGRIADHPASKLDELLPWNWIKPEHQAAAA
jgi:hypothetical protein